MYCKLLTFTGLSCMMASRHPIHHVIMLLSPVCINEIYPDSTCWPRQSLERKSTQPMTTNPLSLGCISLNTTRWLSSLCSVYSQVLGLLDDYGGSLLKSWCSTSGRSCIRQNIVLSSACHQWPVVKTAEVSCASKCPCLQPTCVEL
jgi:hypothetical protein